MRGKYETATFGIGHDLPDEWRPIGPGALGGIVAVRWVPEPYHARVHLMGHGGDIGTVQDMERGGILVRPIGDREPVIGVEYRANAIFSIEPLSQKEAEKESRRLFPARWMDAGGHQWTDLGNCSVAGCYAHHGEPSANHKCPTPSSVTGDDDVPF